jgi:hypothetical protein
MYKFHIGQSVLVEASPHLNMPGGVFVVTKKLPEQNGEFQYRIKKSNEPHERVVRESQMSRVSTRLPV